MRRLCNRAKKNPRNNAADAKLLLHLKPPLKCDAKSFIEKADRKYSDSFLGENISPIWHSGYFQATSSVYGPIWWNDDFALSSSSYFVLAAVAKKKIAAEREREREAKKGNSRSACSPQRGAIGCCCSSLSCHDELRSFGPFFFALSIYGSSRARQ